MPAISDQATPKPVFPAWPGRRRRATGYAALGDQNVGPLYSSFMKALGATGYFGGQSPSGDSLPYVYAALHGSYSAMDSVGRTLSFADDETKQAVGKRMRDCAREMLPVLFGTK